MFFYATKTFCCPQKVTKFCSKKKGGIVFLFFQKTFFRKFFWKKKIEKNMFFEKVFQLLGNFGFGGFFENIIFLSFMV